MPRVALTSELLPLLPRVDGGLGLSIHSLAPSIDCAGRSRRSARPGAGGFCRTRHRAARRRSSRLLWRGRPAARCGVGACYFRGSISRTGCSLSPKLNAPFLILINFVHVKCLANRWLSKAPFSPVSSLSPVEYHSRCFLPAECDSACQGRRQRFIDCWNAGGCHNGPPPPAAEPQDPEPATAVCAPCAFLPDCSPNPAAHGGSRAAGKADTIQVIGRILNAFAAPLRRWTETNDGLTRAELRPLNIMTYRCISSST